MIWKAMRRTISRFRKKIPLKWKIAFFKFLSHITDNSFSRNLRYIIHLLTKDNHRENSKAKVLYLVARPECSLSFFPVFEILKLNENFEVKVYALGNLKKKEQADNTYDMCVKLFGKENVIDSSDYIQNEYSFILDMKPDYIFVDVPYEREYPRSCNFSRLSRLSNLCHIPYGYNLMRSELAHLTYNDNLLENARFIFADNTYTFLYCRKKVFLSEVIMHQRVFNIGFPRFDYWLNQDYKTGVLDNKDKISILWLPRWTTSFEEKRGNWPSSFMLFKDHILAFAKKHPSVRVIIRPHPMMFKNFVMRGVLDEKEIKEYTNEVFNTANVILDQTNSYIDAFKETDILLTDITSLIAEFLLTGRPIICYGMDNNDSVDSDYPDYLYCVKTWSEANDKLEALIQGIDDKSAIRKNYRDNLLNKHSASQEIVKIIEYDFFKRNTDVRNHIAAKGAGKAYCRTQSHQ